MITLASQRAPVKPYFDAVDAMDVDKVLTHFADDATLTVQTDHVTFTGAAEIRRMFTDFFGASVALAPDVVLLEGPPDAEEVMELAARETMRPPVADAHPRARCARRARRGR